jgi:hypothetical protein
MPLEAEMKYMLLIHQGTTPTSLLATDGPFVDTKEPINGAPDLRNR